MDPIRSDSGRVGLGQNTSLGRVGSDTQPADSLRVATTPETITIAIPMFNCEQYIERAVLSVINQTYQNWQLILVDDGSTDSTVPRARELAALDPRIRLLAHKHNAGLAHRLNQIAQLAETDLIARMDGDDVMHPERLRKQLNAFRANPHADIVASRAFALDELDNVIGLFKEASLPTHASGWIHGCPLTHPTLLVTRAWHLANPYDPAMERAEDLELFLRAGPDAQVVKIHCPLLFYRLATNVSYSTYRKNKVYERRAIWANRAIYPAPLWISRLVNSWLKQQLMGVMILMGRSKDWNPSRVTPLLTSAQRCAEMDLSTSLRKATA